MNFVTLFSLVHGLMLYQSHWRGIGKFDSYQERRGVRQPMTHDIEVMMQTSLGHHSRFFPARHVDVLIGPSIAYSQQDTNGLMP